MSTAWASPTGNGSGLPCYTLVLLVFIPIYLKNKVTTVPGFLADRFGPACGTIYSCMLLAFYVCIYMVTVLYAGSLAFSQVTGWNFYVRAAGDCRGRGGVLDPRRVDLGDVGRPVPVHPADGRRHHVVLRCAGTDSRRLGALVAASPDACTSTSRPDTRWRPSWG